MEMDSKTKDYVHIYLDLHHSLMLMCVYTGMI